MGAVPRLECHHKRPIVTSGPLFYRQRVRMTSKNRRKAIIAARSAQARLNANAKRVSELRSYDQASVSRLSDANLVRVAMHLGKEFDDAKKRVAVEQKAAYLNVPKIKLSQRDMMYLSRPLISDQQIASAPSKKRHVLRQQQKRRLEAREKLQRAIRYNKVRQDRSVAVQRGLEISGAVVGDVGIASGGSYGDNRQNAIADRTNVLSDKDFIVSADRGMIVAEILDVADVLGKPLKRADRTVPKSYKNVSDVTSRKGLAFDARQDLDIQRRIEGLMGSRMARRWARMSKKERTLLKITTGLQRVLMDSVTYDHSVSKNGGKRIVYKYANDSAMDKAEAQQMVKDYFDFADRIIRR